MFLKQLEIVGFKSFANKVTIDFHPGVTAVVGPNGSGKSNITDAIRWVLGEQSARTLRGAKMEDIIFAGSDGKRPLNMAEVTLTLDNGDRYLNTDYSEISVTRRVFRSGESEFYLNGQKCRLKDIVDLFMDSGLGREAYSIISQGKIDDILNSKPEEKRKIFEEAAGVLKYKTRKENAEKKLADAQENLNRVEDILYELESQIQPLEDQASVAKEYLEKRSELEAIEVALLAHDIGITHERWQEKTKAVEALKVKALGELADIQKAESEQERLQSAVQAFDESIDDLQAALLAASELHEKYEGEKKLLEERSKNAQENAARFKQHIEELEAQKKDEENALRAEKEKLDAENAKLKDLEHRLAEKTERLARFEKDIDERLEALKSDYFEWMNRGAGVRNEIRYLLEQREQLLKRAERLSEEESEARRRLDAVKAEKQQITRRYDEKAAALKEAREHLRSLDARLQALQAEWEKNRDALQKIEPLIQQASSRRDMLKEMEEEYAGYYGGVKAVLKAKGKTLAGIHGAVAELIRVNKAYEVAVETALGAAMQHIVVDDEAHARAAIQYLKNKKAGRATFLPLSVIRPRRLPEHDLRLAREHEAFVGTGDALVEYDPAYHAVVGQLLGSILVAKDLKGANGIAKRLGYRYRLVTLDGDVVSPGGAMTGGSRKTTTVNLLGRSREIERIGKQIDEMTAKRAEVQSRLEELKKAIRAALREKEDAERVATALAKEAEDLESALKESDFAEKSASDRLALLERERKGFEEERSSLEARIEALKAEQAQISEEEKAMNAAIAELTHQKEHQDEAKKALESEITEMKVALARQQEVVRAQMEETRRRSQQLERLTNELSDARAAVQAFDETLAGHDTDRAALEKRLEESRRDKERISAWIAERRKQRIQLTERLQAGEVELKEKKRVHKETEEALRREEIALERLDVELDNLLNRLREEYELAYETAKTRYPLKMEVEEARRKVKSLKRDIEALGQVNLGAIDEYERVSTRYRFLQEQREDLLQAKETLLNVIAEMDQEVEKRFGDLFKQVRARFQEIFKALFGGGRADLQLTDPDDLLYSGVEIMAEPPGKKLQHLSLLSGGERALTAIALLFAILKVRPVPFCVLDEVEAALDDANVDRYAAFLRNFSKDTQFIVVTHRKGTMENADVLYGVTMQESGVSKLVSVRLEDTEALVG